MTAPPTELNSSLTRTHAKAAIAPPINENFTNSNRPLTTDTPAMSIAPTMMTMLNA